MTNHTSIQRTLSAGITPRSQNTPAPYNGNQLTALIQDGRLVVGLSDGKGTIIEYKPPGQNCTCILLIDCSSSMTSRKLEQAKVGGLGFAEQALAKAYAVGVVCFASDADLVCSPTRNMKQIQRALTALDANGSTNMTDAIDMARTHLADRQATRAIVLATDGMPDDCKSALSAARRAEDEGIQIIAIGTDDANTAFLRTIATAADLASHVEQKQLASGISSAARLLPMPTPTRRF